MTRTDTGRRFSRVPPTVIPDRVIGAFFAVFPIVVAAFLTIQAVRAAGTGPHATAARALTTVSCADAKSEPSVRFLTAPSLSRS